MGKICALLINYSEKLFADIASRSANGNFVNGNSATRINVTNLLSYFNGHPDPLIKKILKNKYVIISAFRSNHLILSSSAS